MFFVQPLRFRYRNLNMKTETQRQTINFYVTTYLRLLWQTLHGHRPGQRSQLSALRVKIYAAARRIRSANCQH